jgi:hypothetical protein
MRLLHDERTPPCTTDTPAHFRGVYGAKIVQAARYVVGARRSKFHDVGCGDNTLAASLGTHVPMDEHIHACNCGCQVPSTSSVKRQQ